MNLFEKPRGVQTRWCSFENPRAEPSRGGLENKGCKGHPCEPFGAGETKTLLDIAGSGIVNRIWMTISDRSPEILRGLRLDIHWDNSSRPAVSAPFGDFFGLGLGRRTPFECALFSDPEGRSFNCFIPMPFRKAARITITNESEKEGVILFYDVDFLLGVEHTPETLYFHSNWRRESPNELGKEFIIMPRVSGSGRFLGCNVGVMANRGYDTWWGEGEVKVRIGGELQPTLCGTGAEDYIGTAWGQGSYAHRTQGCLIADQEKHQWTFYRYHIDDPVYFDGGCEVAIQTIGGGPKARVIEMKAAGLPLMPVSISGPPLVNLLDLDHAVELEDRSLPSGWCNFWRQDDWSATCYFYLDSPEGACSPIAPVQERIAGLSADGDTAARVDA